MSSGDILFILVFIVLPTAVLVSAAWALVFIRMRPEQVVRREESRPLELSPHIPEEFDEEADTIIFATGSSGEESIPEHGESIQPPVDIDPAPLPQPEPTLVPAQYDSLVPQTTEDLSSVEAALVGPVPEPEPETEPEPLEEHNHQELVSSDTSDLPVLESGTDEPEDEVVAEDVLVEDRPGGAEPVGRRRKQSVKLVSGEADAPRTRGRNRESSRQVPQLNRPNRRRDDTPAPDQG